MTKKAVTKVLELKGYARERQEAEVRAAREAVQRQEELLQALERRYRESDNEFCAKREQGCVTLQEIELFCGYLQHLTRQIQRQQAVVAAAAADLALRQRALVEAYQEEKLVTLLHDKIARGEARIADKAEQKRADYGFLTRRDVK